MLSKAETPPPGGVCAVYAATDEAVSNSTNDNMNAINSILAKVAN